MAETVNDQGTESIPGLTYSLEEVGTIDIDAIPSGVAGITPLFRRSETKRYLRASGANRSACDYSIAASISS